MYDKTGKLTRAGAEQIIAEGGSVSINGNLYTSVENLPSEADFAKGDQDAENAARENLLRQQKAIEEQLAKLNAPAQQTATQAEPEQPHAGKRTTGKHGKDAD